MNNSLKTIENFSVKELSLSGNAKICFLTAPGNSPSELPLHLGIIKSISGVNIAGPEIYSTYFGERHGGKYAGEILLPGTNGALNSYCGLQCCMIPKSVSKDVIFKNQKVGVGYEDDCARYVILGGIFPSDKKKCRTAQTISVFENIESVLKSEGMDFSNVVRTWFYNDNILDWYGEFNHARDLFFESRNIFEGLVPASTGIGSSNRYGSALTARAFAILPKSENVKLTDVTSPLQCPALDYRSSFSRAVEISHPNFKQLIISGTAGIEYGGKTAFAGDLEKQINLALDVIEALLKSRGMNWRDTLRAVAYLKDIAFLETFKKIQKKRDLLFLPCVAVQADICRSDLLFEMELDAASPAAE